MYIFQIAKNIFSILTEKQKRELVLLSIFFLLSAFVQIVGIASIAPFISLLSNPEIVHTQKLFVLAYKFLGSQNASEFTVAFASISVAMILLSNAMSALSLWLLIRFSINIGNSTQERLYTSFLFREYIFHKTSNYNKFITMISSETPRFVYMVLQPFLILVSQLLIAFIILTGLVLLNPAIAFASATVIGGAYLGTYLFVKKSMLKHGKHLTERNDQVQQILSESFIGIKEIKLSSLEDKYTKRFKHINYKGLHSTAVISLSGDIPRFAIESISFGAILTLAIVLILKSVPPQEIVSMLIVYSLAGYKLLPTLQQIYKSITNMSANGSVVSDIKHHLQHSTSAKAEGALSLPAEKVKILQLKNISYTYPSNTNPVIHNLSVDFQTGQLNTIAGPSGSGKSTLADIMLGLLPQESGLIQLNDTTITTELISAYQHSIGYVPQNIFILDDTVIANVAFGEAPEDIDIEQVKKALLQANAMEFVQKLPQDIYTPLGQDGKLLSGGQRQRIGIARTLYRNSDILILDEPTSALDIESEFEFMTLLNVLKKDILVIVISHRPAAIKLSDKICIIDSGKILADGSPTELLKSNSDFQELMRKGFMN